MTPPKPISITSDHDLPDKVDVVVIGGGIIGVSTALFLAERKLKVALIEKGEIASEQSGRNQGWVRVSNRDLREIPLAIEATRLWDGMNQRVGAETGYRKCGATYLLSTEKEIGEKEIWSKEAKRYGLDARLLGNSELSQHFPLMHPPRGAMLSSFDGRAEPQLAAPAIALAARRHGARIFTGLAAKAIDITAGRISGVFTERGTIGCDGLVVAAGAWTSIFLRRYGMSIPQLKVRSSVMKIDGAHLDLEMNIASSQFLLRRRLDGGYTLAHAENHAADVVPDSFRYFRDFLPVLRRRMGNLPIRLTPLFMQESGYSKFAIEQPNGIFERYRTVEPLPRKHQSLNALKALQLVLPAARNVKVEQHWAGYVDVTPDEVPVISLVPEIPGMVVATGFSGHGFGIGPGAGHLAADLVTSEVPIVDPSAFDIARFQYRDR